MGLTVWLVASGLLGLAQGDSFGTHLLVAGGGSLIGLLVYLLGMRLLRVPDLALMRGMLR